MKSILIVDDESKIRSIYRSLLSADRYKIIEASNAGEACDILAGEKIDLVLLDINMPEIKGDLVYNVIEMFQLRTKVIVCSVRCVNEQRRLIQGAVDYYDKSEGLEVLQLKIEKNLEDGGNERG